MSRLRDLRASKARRKQERKSQRGIDLGPKARRKPERKCQRGIDLDLRTCEHDTLHGRGYGSNALTSHMSEVVFFGSRKHSL